MKNMMIRIWVYVEWVLEKSDIFLLEEFELIVDNFVEEEGIVLVCVYVVDFLFFILDIIL